MLLAPSTELQFIKGIGPHLGGLLAKLGLHRVSDFWFFFPRRYDDRRALPSLNRLQAGPQSAVGIIQAVQDTPTKTGRSIIRARISDETGTIEAIWFNQPFLKKSLKPGVWIWVHGKWERNSFTQRWELAVAEHELATGPDVRAQLGVGSVVPIYPSTPGLSVFRLRHLATQLVSPESLGAIHDPFGPDWLSSFSLMGIQDAIRHLHFPQDRERYKQAKHRIIFDDFFYFQLSLAQNRVDWKKIPKAPPLRVPGPLHAAYLAALPYTLTQAQQDAVTTIYQDLAKPTRMNRLLQGDVGCGKTDVCILAVLAAVDNGLTGAIMAPTEILAQQHYNRLTRQLGGLGVQVELLKGSLTAKTRRLAMERILAPGPKIIVGTHALLESDVVIPDLAVVVIDEQHRFGVDQRHRLQEKGMFPHCLLMTATPIPRSLMLTCFGDLDKTLISELPPGRILAQTQLVAGSELADIYRFCRSEISAGRQAYVVYPLVEESAKLDLKSAEEGFELLKGLFPEFRVGLLHGKMKAAQKAEVMAAFVAGDLHILVSTTVIEVGVDVPNASIMLIQHAERFGLAQLHQLRGRIGRGGHAAYCYLVPSTRGGQYNPRLRAMVSTQDGFKLAEYDLALRGPGDLLGKRQAGLPLFRLADLIRDEAVLKQARQAAFKVVELDPHLQHPAHQRILAELLSRYSRVAQPN